MLVLERHGNRINDSRATVYTLGCKNRVYFFLLDFQLSFLLLHDYIFDLDLLVVTEYIEPVHEGETAGRVLLLLHILAFLVPLFDHAVLDHADFVGKDVDLFEFVAVEGGVDLDNVIEAVAVEAMHTGEDVELHVEERLEALLALMGGINFDAAVLDHAELLLEPLCVGRVVVHEPLEPGDFLAIALEGVTDFVLEVLNFDVLVEVGQQVLDLHHLGLLGELDHLADLPLLHEVVLGDLNPQLLLLVLVLGLVGVLFRHLLLVVLQSQRDRVRVKVHLPVHNDLGLDYLIVLEESQSEVQIEVKSAFLHHLNELGDLVLGGGGVEEDENVVQTALPAAALLDAVPEQLNAVHPLPIGDVHQPCHQFDGLKVSDVLDQQVDRLLRFVAEKDVRVLVDHVCDLVILHTLKVLERLVIALLREVVHHDHLEVVLLVREVDQVLDAAVGLHDKVDQVFVDHVKVTVDDFLQLLLPCLQLLLYLSCPLLVCRGLLPFQVVQLVHDQLHQPRNQKTLLRLVFWADLLQPVLQIDLQPFSRVVAVRLQKLQENLLKVPRGFAKICGSFRELSLRKQIVSIQPCHIGHIFPFSLADYIGLLILLLGYEQFPCFCAFLAGVKLRDPLITEDPEYPCVLLVAHIADQTSFELMVYHYLLRDCGNDGDGLLKKEVIVEVGDADVDGVLLHLVSLLIGQIYLLGESEGLISGEERVIHGFIPVWHFEVDEVGAVGPQDGSGPFGCFGVARVDQALVASRHRDLLDLVGLILIVEEEDLQIIQPRDAEDGGQRGKYQNHVTFVIRLRQPQHLDGGNIIRHQQLDVQNVGLHHLSAAHFKSVEIDESVVTAEDDIA